MFMYVPHTCTIKFAILSLQYEIPRLRYPK